jgi:amidophosphoribosyltransferase
MVANNPVVQDLYDGLITLQHRGQDAAGIATDDGRQLHMKKGNGLVRDVFRTKNMIRLKGSMGIGHVRYPTAGCYTEDEAQPFYVNAPFGIVMGHNGNLTNYEVLKREVIDKNHRHLNTTSDSELLLNILAYELLQEKDKHIDLDPKHLFSAMDRVYRRIEGGYAVVGMIANQGLLAFRDPNGIRPLIIGKRETSMKTEYMVASESVTLQTMGFEILRDVNPGEVVYIRSKDHEFFSHQSVKPDPTPCIFEFVYLARPDSLIDSISVYKTRLRMGKKLGQQIKKDKLPIDVIIPVPETSRPIAMAMSEVLKVRYREGFIKNRYIGRTFIMPNQQQRKKSIRYKLNPIPLEFKGKNVMLVDDSIVRGNTSRKIVEMVREAGAEKVYFASAAPPIVNPDVYGIDMPTRKELIANRLSIPQIAEAIGVDRLYYQKIDDLLDAAREGNPKIKNFCYASMGGPYPAGNITEEVLQRVEHERFMYQTAGATTDDEQIPLL